jgi:hypothetical protein
MKKHYKWTYNLAKAEASKYETRTQFRTMAGGCYMYALKNNFLDDICSHMNVLKKRWTKNNCIEAAKKHDYFYEFKKKDCDAYMAARRHGWEKEIKGMLKAYTSKWGNKETVLLEAKKYETKKSFRKYSKGAYEACYRNGWVKEACAHMSMLSKSKSKVWTKEKCLTEILKYENRSDFRKKSRGAYQACKLNNWFSEEIAKLKVKKVVDWTKDKCWQLAKRYKSKKDFKINQNGAYLFALRRGWKDEICSHMDAKFTFWTKEKCKIEASKYKSRSEYARENGASYQFAMKQGEEFMSSICSHMTIKGSRYKRMVYAYEFADNHVYVGLTYNEQKRKDEHLGDKRGPVARHSLKSGISPDYKKLEDYLDVKDAKNLEQYYIDWYKKAGWLVLNRSKAGALGTTDTLWTKERCHEEALKFNRKEDLRFAQGLGGLYNAARKRGWWDEICSHMNGGNKRWTKEDCLEFARKCKSISDFQRKYGGAYIYAKGNGFLTEINSQITKPPKEFKYLSYNEARDFARSNSIKTSEQWFEFCKTKKVNEKVPTAVSRVYKGKGWKGWADFLVKEDI